MQNRSKRRFEVHQNLEPIRPNQLPEFGIDKNPNKMFRNTGVPQPTPGANIPSFDISGLPNGTAPPPIQQLPPLDFKAQQRAVVDEHIARDTAAREAAALKAEQEQAQAPMAQILVKEPRVTIPMPNESKYTFQRVYVPSQGVCGYDAVFIRPLDATELLLLHQVRASKSDTALFDALGRCFQDFDIRTLSLGDFRFLYYWLKINSYTRNPFTVRFISKYGNKNVITLKMSDLVIKPLELEDDDIAYYESKKFCIPTLRDGEEVSRLMASLPETTDAEKAQKDLMFYRCTYAQYVQGTTLQEKLENLTNNYSPDDWVDIMEFAAAINKFGVEEKVTVIDQHFDADKALVYLKNGLKEIEKLDLSTIKNAEILTLFENNKADISAEIQRIETEISNTGEAAATSETVTFSLSLDDFFPENIAQNT